MSAAIDQTVAEHGIPDRLVACAGIGASGMLLDQTPGDWQRVIDTNLTGTWLTLRAVARAMVDAGSGGSIVAVSSISGTLADRDMGAYCVSKAGIDMLVRVAATEWGVHGIRVNAVGPGVTRTPMLAKPEQLPGWTEGLTERTRSADSATPTTSPRRSSPFSKCLGSQHRPFSPTVGWHCTAPSTPTGRYNA